MTPRPTILALTLTLLTLLPSTARRRLYHPTHHPDIPHPLLP